ncbi:MAG: acyl-ACP--UDP-N-acetylglucosamine O-acyltransferase [Mariprofundaceae bacterium]
MKTFIHPTAIVDPAAILGEGVHIGPFCTVGPEVRLGDGCHLQSHVVITGRTTIGRENRFFPFASIGQIPQDLKYHGEPSRVEIGDGNTFRESVTVNAGTEGGGMVTRIGSGGLFMAYAHVAHDCILGDRVIMANCATLAGHVEVADGAIIGGLAAVHQFLKIGRMAMIGGTAGVNKHVPPFCMVSGGYRPNLVGLNLVGLKRAAVPQEEIRALKAAYRALLQQGGKLDARLAQAREAAAGHAMALELVDFVAEVGGGVTLPGRDG